MADAGLRLLCPPETQHMARTGQHSGWSRPYDRPGNTTAGRERKGGQVYDASTTSSCTCGRSATSPTQPGARALAEQHRRDATSSNTEPTQPPRA
ncbi:hypothetical protein ACSYGO_07125 [Streptomyces krungchingensis]